MTPKRGLHNVVKSSPAIVMQTNGWAEEELRTLLQEVASGGVSPEAALTSLHTLAPSATDHFGAPTVGTPTVGVPALGGNGAAPAAPVELVLDEEDRAFARVDHERAARQGFPEVIFCAGKTPQQVALIAERLYASDAPLLATRATVQHFEATRERVPQARWHEMARIITVEGRTAPALPGTVGLLCAGTSDLPVAEEARITLITMGVTMRTFYDCGVAGLHRLLAVLPEVRRCNVLICVAGMEGALPSVLAGLVSVPVIAVPTSVGYGASFGGLAALLGMLNSCANGVTVTNIDNGFGAAAFAASVLRSAPNSGPLMPEVPARAQT